MGFTVYHFCVLTLVGFFPYVPGGVFNAQVNTNANTAPGNVNLSSQQCNCIFLSAFRRVHNYNSFPIPRLVRHSVRKWSVLKDKCSSVFHLNNNAHTYYLDLRHATAILHSGADVVFALAFAYPLLGTEREYMLTFQRDRLA